MSACDRCAAGERHPFAVRVWGDEGGPVTYTVQAIGPHEARELGGWKADADGYYDASVTAVDHAPALDDEEEPDPIDLWRDYRDAGYSEPELRAIGGDR